MLFKRNLLENITFVSCSGTVICVLLNYLTNISPITGVWFPLYIFLLFVFSVWISFRFIQWLLHLSKPVKYDVERIINDYPQLVFLSRLLPKKTESKEWNEYDTNELSVISSVLERKLVSSWYMPYISQEIGFPFACKQMLDQIILKTFQICNHIEIKDIHIDICTILASHLKEYKKAVKRQENSPTSSIDSLYKKSHPMIITKYQNPDHCIFILRIILKELVPWELWDTPHSELLVRILAKKLDNFIDNTLADPVWLNDRLMSLIADKECTKLPEGNKVKEELVQVKQEPPTDMPTIAKPPNPIIVDKVEAMVKIESIVEETVVSSSDPVDIKSSPILRQRRGRQGRNEVKIYDRIIEGSVKTWDTDIDLQCISMGQDLLASLDGELSLGRLWAADEPEPGAAGPDRPQPLWFGEDDMELEAEWGEGPRKEAGPKAGDALLKDLQSTVHQAKTRIGDLQDEAAGMMEGLLDFGIAGLKKGLRFTGLSDDSQDKSPPHLRDKPGDKSPPAEARGKAIPEHTHAITSITHKDDSEVPTPPLVKQHRVISQDSVPILSQPAGELGGLESGASSPEPQYEEAADLSTSIAKLRCLLQQRADTEQRAEAGGEAAGGAGGAGGEAGGEVWWERAEETRGRTQLHHSSRPVDTATLADEYDMSIERNPSPGQASNNMQRLDKLFQRTVTGVFNSIKTAVGAEGEAPPAPRPASRPAQAWAYVCAAGDRGVCASVPRLVGAGRALVPADAAMDPLRGPPPPPAAPEDVEEWCAWCGPGWGAACGAAAAAGLLRSHVAHRMATLLLADLAETLITTWLKDFGSWLRKQVFVAFEQMAQQEEPVAKDKATLRPFDKDETCAAVLAKIPLVYVFGEESLSGAVQLVISSFSHKEVNKDFILRVIDLIALHFKTSAEASHPTFDNN